MAPIRVGLVGLSVIDVDYTTLGNWGVLAHLKPLLESPHYELVAVCNSTVESAQKAIDFHKLPSTVKAYGSVDDMSKDPNVDLVSVSVNVAKHYALTKPAILNNKDVLVEWPLGASLEEAEELTQLSKKHNVKAMVGLQLRSDPLLAKVKELVDGGAIGQITSSVASGCSSILPIDGWIHDATYYLDINTGGNEFHIFFGHFLDSFTFILGDFKTTQSTLKTQHPTVPLFNMATGELVDKAYPKTSPDHIFVQGELESGAVASISFRKAKKPADGLALRWFITGTEGEIEVTIPEDHLQMGPAGREIRLRKGKETEIEVVQFGQNEPAHVTTVPYPGTNTAREYEAFATGVGHYADFEASLKNHQLLDKILKGSNFL